jgi:hypothetical protein
MTTAVLLMGCQGHGKLYLNAHTADLPLQLLLADLPAPPCRLQHQCSQPVLLEVLLQPPPEQPCPHRPLHHSR